jgi:hypothetical protein
VPQELQGPLFSKTYRTRRSGRILGKLKGFMDLPLDVVFEVSLHVNFNMTSKCGGLNVARTYQTAMYLAPKDLLQFSRLSKRFRSMFTSRSALFVWQTVFRNVDLKCFEDLNEIQFASLLYDKCCMVTFCFFLYHINYTYDFFLCSLQACGRITMGCLIFPVLRLRLCPCCQTAK